MSQVCLISVILPNYNGRHLLERNLPSILRALGHLKFEIIVVDDCSTDDTVNFLREQYPEIVLLEHSANKGFSKTCNTGIFNAKGKYVCVTNTDVTFDKNYFEVTLGLLESSSAFAVKGQIVNCDARTDVVLNIDTTARLFQKRGLLRFDKTVEAQPEKIGKHVGCHLVFLGCCFVADRELLVRLRGFDTIFSPFYWEDADLPLRAMKNGYKVLYSEHAVVYHQLSSTINQHRKKAWRKLVSDRNKFIFSWRHMEGGQQWLSHVLHISFGVLIRWIRLDYSFYLGFSWALMRYFRWPFSKADHLIIERNGL